MVHTPRALEPHTPDLGGLLEAFDRMIDRQIAASAVRQGRLHVPRVRPVSRAVSELLARAPARVVLARAETVRITRDVHALVHVTALRMIGGASFELVLRPPDLTSAKLPHLGLDPDRLATAASLDVLRDRWPTFFGDDDLLACWGATTPAVLASAIPRPEHVIDLKASYCNLRRAAAGALDEVLRREGLAPDPSPFAGRAGRVMGALWPVARLLAERAIDDPARGRVS